jgi:type II secretory pathway component PulJ
MTSLLDAIFATSIGGLFLITIFTTLFNLQASSQDTTFHVTLNNAAEVQYQEIDNCLGKVGAGVYSGQILVAEPDSFVSKLSMI